MRCDQCGKETTTEEFKTHRFLGWFCERCWHIMAIFLQVSASQIIQRADVWWHETHK